MTCLHWTSVLFTQVSAMASCTLYINISLSIKHENNIVLTHHTWYKMNFWYLFILSHSSIVGHKWWSCPYRQSAFHFYHTTENYTHSEKSLSLVLSYHMLFTCLLSYWTLRLYVNQIYQTSINILLSSCIVNWDYFFKLSQLCLYQLVYLTTCFYNFLH